MGKHNALAMWVFWIIAIGGLMHLFSGFGLEILSYLGVFGKIIKIAVGVATIIAITMKAMGKF